MTTMTCTKCGHIGEHLADAPGFCAKCKTLVAVMDSSWSGMATPQAGAPSTLPRGMCLVIAVACTVLQWSVLLWLALDALPEAALIDPGTAMARFNQYAFTLVLGGAMSTAICWFFAFRRRPFTGAMLGAVAGAVVVIAAWVIASRFFG